MWSYPQTESFAELFEGLDHRFDLRLEVDLHVAEVVFDVFLHELAWNIKHHLAVDEAVELDEGEGGRVLLGCDIVADDAETFIPHE